MMRLMNRGIDARTIRVVLTATVISRAAIIEGGLIIIILINTIRLASSTTTTAVGTALLHVDGMAHAVTSMEARGKTAVARIECARGGLAIGSIVVASTTLMAPSVWRDASTTATTTTTREARATTTAVSFVRLIRLIPIVGVLIHTSSEGWLSTTRSRGPFGVVVAKQAPGSGLNLLDSGHTGLPSKCSLNTTAQGRAEHVLQAGGKLETSSSMLRNRD
jgi:hypothetical protein